MPNRSSGLSLTEAILAIFLLLTAFTVVISLFQNGLRYSTRVQNQQLAVMVAERKLEEMRGWAQTIAGTTYNFDSDWSTYNGVSAVAPDYPQFTVSTSVVNQTLYSDCSQFEAANPAGMQRQMLASCKRVKVAVGWNGGAQSLALTTLIGSPPRQLQSIGPVNVVCNATSPISTLAKDGELSFNVTVYDVNGTPIKDAMFLWDVLPGKGNGTLVQSRDGSCANFTNAVSNGGPVFYTGGSVVVQPRARIHGVKAAGNSSLIPLAGP